VVGRVDAGQTTKHMSRLFVALWPPDSVIATLEALHRKDQVGARFVPPENWHVTLRFLGNADPNDTAAALDRADLRDTIVRLGPAVDVGNGRTLFVPAAGADDLAAEVVRVTRHLGDEPVRQRFLGHVTIARLKRGANMPRALGELIEATWTPTEIALVESTLRPDGPRYDTLRTWPIPTA
jgi:RNA 2',3'-cyclic 3'-phosphodiesterase